MTSEDRPQRILMIRPSALGDVCRSVPVLVSLRNAFPHATIDWMVRDTFAAAVASHPALNAVVEFPRKRLGSSARRLNLVPTFRWLGVLRARGYDAVYDLQGLARSGLFARATGAARRVGFANAREMGWLGYNERYGVDTELHSVDRMLELVKRAGVTPVRDLRLYAPEIERELVRDDPLLAGRRYVVLAPTSRWAGKRWAADGFVAVASELLMLGVERVVVVGSGDERSQCGPLIELAARDPRVIDRIGSTSVGGLMALIESSALVIANDSAALHMGVGFDRPIIGLYGPTDVQVVGPYAREHDVIQHIEPGDRFEHKAESVGRAMMERILVGEVIERARLALLRY